MLRVLALLMAVRAVGEFGLNGLLGLGKVGVRTVLTGACAVLALALYIVLIPVWSWRGAVVGTFTSEIVLATGAWAALLYHQRRHDASLPARVVKAA
jgi:O-antigen/teichoic acid export membrane protein